LPTRAIFPVPFNRVPRRTDVMSEQSVPGPRRMFALRTLTVRVRATTGSSNRNVTPDVQRGERSGCVVGAANAVGPTVSATAIAATATANERVRRENIGDLPGLGSLPRMFPYRAPDMRHRLTSVT
jgi:hypothetical protein